VGLASTFAASLELSRQQVLEADQTWLFAEINVRSAT
jgi:chromatin segregation and condensation protein Rec8/ScpA/Scc1 (kleisin family)